MYTKIAPITINTEKKANGAAKIFIADPAPSQEQLAGKLFILIEVEAKKSDANKIIDFVISDINTNYYQNDKLLLREKIEALKIENIFETVLVKTNKNLIDFISNERIALSPRSINATIGIIFNSELHFSNIGTNQALLLYKEDSDSSYKMINVEKSEDTKEIGGDNLSFKKLFSSIISGEMPSKSYFLFANEALAEYLFNQELIEIITKLAPLGAAEQIKNTLVKINSYIPFLGLIIKNNINGDEAENITQYRQTEASQIISNSRNEQPSLDLKSTEEKTAQILAPSGGVNTKKVSNFCARALRALNPFRLIGRLFKKIFRRDSSLANISTTTLDRTALSAETPRSSKRGRKILIFVLILALVLFLANMVYQRTKVMKTEERQENKSYEDYISQKINQAESYRLYEDKKSTKEILTELQTYLDNIPAEKKDKIEGYQEWLNKFEELMSWAQNITKMEQLKVAADFSDLASPESIMLVDGKIFGADSSKKTIYRISLKDNLNSVISSDQIKSNLKYPALGPNGLIYYLGEGQIITLNTKDEKISANKMVITEGQNIIDLDNYNGKLYALDKAKNQLYRYSLTNNEYPQGEARLKTKLEAADINSFAIDNTGTQSDIYFLKASGEVKKFYDGSEKTFTLDVIEPKFSNPTIIKVLNDIYILDPANKRLAVFNKNGKAIKQYQSDQLNDLKDFSINEKDKKAYLLAGNVVYELPL